jgi:hypothetical protein
VAPNNSSAWRGPYRGDFRFSPPIPRVSKPIETFISSPVSTFVTHQPIRVTHNTLAHSQTPQFVGRIKARTNPILAKLPPKKRSEIGFADNELANDPPQMTGEEAPSEQVVFAQKVQGATPVGTLPQKSPRTFTQPKSPATGGDAQPLIPEATQFTMDSLPNVTVTDSGRTLVGRTRARHRGPTHPAASDGHKSGETDQQALPLRQQNESAHDEVLSSSTHIDENLQGHTTEAQRAADKPEVSPLGATESSTVNSPPVSHPITKSWRPKIPEKDTQDPAKSQAHQTITPLDDTPHSPSVLSSEPSAAENTISPVSHPARNPEAKISPALDVPSHQNSSAPTGTDTRQVSETSAAPPIISDSTGESTSEKLKTFSEPEQFDLDSPPLVTQQSNRQPSKAQPHHQTGGGNRSSHETSLPSQLAGPVSPNRPINTGPVPSSLGGGEGLVQRRKSQPDGPRTLGSPSQFKSEPMLAKSGSLITEPAATHSTDDPDQSPKEVVQPSSAPTVDATATPHPAKAEVLTVPADVRSAVTSVMGSSPNIVTVHRGTGVQQKADILNAEAFTQNGEVHIPGDLPLTSSPMKRLLAHELTHVVQQHGQLNTKSENSPLGQLLENQALEVETAHSTADAMPVTLPALPSKALAPARDQQPVYKSSSQSNSFMPSSRGGKPINSLTRVIARPTPSTSNLTLPASIVRPLADGTASSTTTPLSGHSRGGETVRSDSSARTGPPVNNSANSSPVTSPVPTPVSESSSVQRRQKKISAASANELTTSSTTNHIPQPPAAKQTAPEIDTVRETKPIETSIDRDWLERHAEALYPLIKKYLRNDLLKDRERRGKLMRDN